MIIARYITKEIGLNFLGVSFVLVFVALSNRFVAYLAKAATGHLPVGLVLKVVALYIPELFSLLAPLSLFIAILFAQGRLHADSESAVLFTSGYDWGKLTKTTLTLAFFMSLIVCLLTTWLVPNITEYRERMLAMGEAVGVMHSITPGRFQTLDEGRLVFYVEDVDENDDMTKIFIAEQPHPYQVKPGIVITAERATIKEYNQQGKFFLVLKDGYRYSGKPGSADYTIVSFAEYGREILLEPESVPSFHRLKTTLDLIDSENLGDKAELQWRLSIPISVIVLALLAIPLARVDPRQGRFAKFIPAIIFYLIYYNLMTVVKRWVADGSLSSEWGLWWVHVLVFFLACLMLLKTSGRLGQFKYTLINRKSLEK